MRRTYHSWKYLLIFAAIASLLAIRARGANGPQVASLTPQAEVTTPGSHVIVDGSGFFPDATVYFDGLEARETGFISASKLEVTTPYLRPGTYRIQVSSKGATVRSDVTFTALPAPVDSEIDRAVELVGQGKTAAAIDILTPIAETDSDFQVRAFAHYEMGQIHFAQEDWARWDADIAGIFLNTDKSGRTVQTYWKYRLADSETMYYLHPKTRAGFDIWYADYSVEYDPTQNSELRFFRGLLNTRQGDLTKAKLDSDYILSVDPSNPSYRALAAYVAALAGDKSQLQSLPYDEMEKDPRALRLLGEAAYLSGDNETAKRWWVAAGRADPERARLTCMAGDNHLRRGNQRVAAALLAGCSAMSPSSEKTNGARNLLATPKK
jgi:hypothetical protein